MMIMMINDGDGNDGDHNDYQDYGHSDNVDYDHYHEEGASVGTQSHLASREARLWHCCHDSHSQADHQYIQIMVSSTQHSTKVLCKSRLKVWPNPMVSWLSTPEQVDQAGPQ